MSFDETTGQEDAEIIAERTRTYWPSLEGEAVLNALIVFVTDPQLRKVIEALDPKAMEQARKALLLA